MSTEELLTDGYVWSDPWDYPPPEGFYGPIELLCGKTIIKAHILRGSPPGKHEHLAVTDDWFKPQVIFFYNGWRPVMQ